METVQSQMKTDDPNADDAEQSSAPTAKSHNKQRFLSPDVGDIITAVTGRSRSHSPPPTYSCGPGRESLRLYNALTSLHDGKYVYVTVGYQ